MENRSIEEIIKAAEEAHERKSYKEEAAFWQEGADLGDAYCQYRLGWCYRHGIGVPLNVRTAFPWFLKAAEQGLSASEYEAGIYYRFGYGNVEEDPVKAAFWLAKSAEHGSFRAQFSLADMYQNGEGVNKDAEKAVYWYERAAEQDYALAMVRLGYCYETGLGVKRDYEKAFHWYTKAADLNDSTAQYCLGLFYEKGLFVNKDPAKAVFWFAKSADLNMPFAQYELARYYEKGEVVPLDLLKAEDLYDRALGCGYTVAEKPLKRVRKIIDQANKKTQ